MTVIYNFFAAFFLSTSPINELPKEPTVETQSKVCVPMPIGNDGDFECIDPYGIN